MTELFQTPEQQQAAEALREKERIITEASWRKLAKNPDFQRVFYHDLQKQFPVFACSFIASDGYNPRAAALREGSRQLVGYIHSKIIEANNPDEDPQEKPTEAL